MCQHSKAGKECSSGNCTQCVCTAKRNFTPSFGSLPLEEQNEIIAKLKGGAAETRMEDYLKGLRDGLAYPRTTGIEDLNHVIDIEGLVEKAEVGPTLVETVKVR